MRPDVLVVGGGPAGAAAALWGHSLGWRVLLLERAATLGGQLHQIHFAPSNYPAAIAGDGPVMANRIREQLEAAGIELAIGTEVVAIDVSVPAVRDAAGRRHEANAVVIATGVRRRVLAVAGEHELEGHGVSYSARQDRAAFAGEDVVVVGGGDAAFENALLLTEVGCRVTLVVRGQSRARSDFRKRVDADARIELVEHTRVVAIEGEKAVRSVALEGERGAYSIPAAGVVIKIGVQPNTEWCREALECDPEGYVLVDETLCTSSPRVWAAGDVTRPPVMGLTLATGQGTLAVASIRDVARGPGG